MTQNQEHVCNQKPKIQYQEHKVNTTTAVKHGK